MRSLRGAFLILLFVASSVFHSVSAQEPEEPVFDAVAGPYEYNQPDAVGDAGEGTGAPRFADITSFAVTRLENGSILMQMKFVDLAGATGDLRYCVFFTVGDTRYQTGLRGRFVNGAAETNTGVVTPCTWADSGASVGMPEIDAEHDQVRIVLPTHQIPSINETGFAVMSDISVQIGAVVPGVGQGAPDLFDALTPSVEPVEYWYRDPVSFVGRTIEVGGNDTATVFPGDNATYALTFTNPGSRSIEANLSLTPNGDEPFYNGTIEPGTILLEAGASANVTVVIPVPMDATPGNWSVGLLAESGTSSSGFISGVTIMYALTLNIEPPAPSEPPADVSASAAATNETMEGKAEDAKGVPGLGVLTVPGLFVAAILAARRRHH